jgi:hypothetical protein
MATYYVRPDGNDTNTGLNANNVAGTGAFRTVNKALSVAVGGDTVWIAPGVYRENVVPTATLSTSSYIDVKGDSALTQVAWGAGLTAGIVRITNNLTSDAGSPTSVVFSLTNRAYYRFSKIRFDGAMTFSGNVLNGLNTSFYDCQLIGNGAITVITITAGGDSGYPLNLLFSRCYISNMPFRFRTTQSQYLIDLNVRFDTCLFEVCSSNDGTYNAMFYNTPDGGGSGTEFGGGFKWINCTLIGGLSTPVAIWRFISGGSATIFIYNNLVLTTAITSVFYGAYTTVIRENYNAGISLTRTATTAGANSFNLTTVPVDTLESYSQSLATRLPYTPLPNTSIVGGGTNPAIQIGGYTGAISFNCTSTAYDFSNNNWNANPSIGYMDNRIIATVPGAGGYVPLDRAVQTITTTAGSTGVSVHIYLGSTGVTFQTPNLTCYYARDNGASVQIPLVQGNASTWLSGGLFEVSSTTMPGVYKFDIPNAVIQAGAKSASIMLRGANAFNGAFVNINIEGEPQPNYVSTNEFRLASEDAGYNNVLELNANTATTVKLQLLDMYQAPTNIAGATLSVEVYNSTNNLVASYTPTVRYAGNGEITFVLSTDVSATYGDYNVYCTKTSGSTDSVVYGPLSLRIRRL